MPLKELKAYKRIHLKQKEKANVTIEVPSEAFCYYDQSLNYGLHNGDFEILIGTSSEHILETFHVKTRNGIISAAHDQALKQ